MDDGDKQAVDLQRRARMKGVVIVVVRVVCRACGVASAIAILGIMVVTVSDVLGRWLFGEPVRGAPELGTLGLIVSVFLGLAYAEYKGEHISVDIVYRWTPDRLRIVFDLFAWCTKLLVIGLCSWQLLVYQQSVESRGLVSPILRLPLSHLVLVATVGSAVFFLATLTFGFRAPFDQRSGKGRGGGGGHVHEEQEVNGRI